jgi:predicted dehydrogenase
VPLAESIEHLCQQVDAVLLTSVDGRVHLRQAQPVLAARKPLFVDKPMAASLADALVMFELARRHRTPIMSSSALRFGRTTQEVRAGAVGKVLKAETFCPVLLEPTHPELFWYGIHGIEALFTIMGPGCRRVRHGRTEDGRIEVVGTWTDGRTGIFRQAPGNKGYGGRAVGERGESEIGTYDGYAPLLREVIRFFRTGVSPIPEQETVEILAFMEAAEESRLNQGAVVELEAVVRHARELAARQLEGEPRTNP